MLTSWNSHYIMYALCYHLALPNQPGSILPEEVVWADRFHGQRHQALEWLCANELANDLKAVEQTGASPWKHGQGAGPECGYLSSGTAGALGCLLPQDSAGAGSIHAALLSVQGLQKAETPGIKMSPAILVVHCYYRTTPAWCNACTLPGMQQHEPDFARSGIRIHVC